MYHMSSNKGIIKNKIHIPHKYGILPEIEKN